MTRTNPWFKEREIKPTAIRELVLKVFMNSKVAVSLADIEQQFDKVDRTTLYRTLKTFEENKLIHSIDDGTGAVKYALCKEACTCNPNELHVHFHCNKCSNTFCLSDIPVPNIILPSTFKLESVNMVIKGACSNCVNNAT